MIDEVLRRLRAYTDLEDEPHSIAESSSRIQEIDACLAASTGPVWVRVDLDIKVKDGVLADRTRVEAAAPTLSSVLAHHRTPVVLGHVGRDPAATARPIAQAFANAVGARLVFVEDWLDLANLSMTSEAIESVHGAGPGEIVVLENTRKYPVETQYWSGGAGHLSAKDVAELAINLSSVVSSTFINEAIAANNYDFSTCILPTACDGRALGGFFRHELRFLAEVQGAEVVVISGLKANKLDDLERIISSTPVRTVFVGGALAAPLVKAAAKRVGRDVSLGRVEYDDSNPAFVPAERFAQAQRIVDNASQRGVVLHLPTDFVLDDGSTSTTVPSDRVQLDVGPATRAEFSHILESIANASDGTTRVFFNGALGLFEQQQFSEGTKEFVQSLSSVADRLRIFVGGGEGRLAFSRFGNLESAYHAFTAGGTVLKAVARRPLFPLLSLEYASDGEKG